MASVACTSRRTSVTLPTTRAAAVVTDVQLRSVVAGLRGLGRAGIPIVAVAATPGSAGLWSRYTGTRKIVGSVLVDPAAFAESVVSIAAGHRPAVVYPGREEALDALLAVADGLPSDVVLPYPEPAVVRSLRHKPALAELASSVGLRSPRTIALGSAGELSLESRHLPCVIKQVDPGGAVTSTSMIESEAEFRAFLAPLPAEQRLLVQERVSGPLIALALVLSRDGRVAARFQQRTVRTWPARAGGSSLAVGVAPDERLVEQAAALLSRAGYWGIAQLQFMVADEGPALIDINPRFYGTLPLASASGVNLPAAWHAVALGGPVSPPGPYRVGVAYRWFEAEIHAALRGMPDRLICTAPQPRAGAMRASDDPLPSAILAARAATDPVQRLVVRRASRVVRIWKSRRGAHDKPSAASYVARLVRNRRVERRSR